MADSVENWGTWFGALSAIAGALFGIFKWIISPILRQIEEEKAFRARLRILLNEFKPREGHSVPELLARANDSIESISTTITRLEKTQLFKEEMLRSFAQSFGLGMYETESDGRCRWVSPHWSNLMGISLEEAKGNGWIFGIAKEDRERLSREWKLAVDEGRRFDISFKTESGHRVRSQACPVRSGTEIIGWVGVIQEEQKPRRVSRED